MIRLARQQATHEESRARFDLGVIEALAFDHASFDIVLVGFVLHHLPPDLKTAGLREIRRVLKPHGRLIVVEIDRPERWFWRMLLWPLRLNLNLKDHIDGRTAAMLLESNFVDITQQAQWGQWVTFWQARKP
jgi:SAM-dependent methyltransferase